MANGENTLVVSSEEALRALPDAASLRGVEEIYLGARLYGALSHAELAGWIARLPALRVIHLSDDWIPDAQMDAVAAAFAASFPDKAFFWTCDGLAGGKHGR
ncbi:hypothetical protein ANT2_3290 [plant metagenome]|uniref:Uncharacterized protein n=1 Tax=plant metagenome TaxID=1297885 RepID=A0A484QW18_9ZZZZ